MRRAALALALLLALAGCGQAPDAAVAAAPPNAATAVTTAALDPSTVSIPSIGATGPLEPLGVDARGGWAVPDVHAPAQASWYSLGPTPGSVGPAVILGHVNGPSASGRPGGTPGVFAKLHLVKPGAQVVVASRDGRSATFRVDRVQTLSKAPRSGTDLPVFDGAAILAPTPDAQLRLITCGGTLDQGAHRYLDSVVVWASKV